MPRNSSDTPQATPMARRPARNQPPKPSGRIPATGRVARKKLAANASRLFGRRIQGPFDSRDGGSRRRRATNSAPTNISAVAASRAKPRIRTVQPETVYQDRQQRRQDEAAGGGDVGPGHVPVALYHMVQVHQVATRHLQEAADPVDLGGSAAAPHEEALRGAEHGKCQGGEEQDGKEGVEHFWSPCGTSGGAGSAPSPACGRGGSRAGRMPRGVS